MTLSRPDAALVDALRQRLDVAAFSGKPADFPLDGLEPALVCSPSSQEEAAAVLAVADEHGAAVVPWGGGSQMPLGMPPARYDLALDLRRVDRVVEHEPADLTVTVEAGIRLSELQRRLGERGQWLPLDPPVEAGATIGGLLAANSSGPGRVAYGTARDLVIGMTVALASGEVVKSGGRVVKNVAGYDMAKLHIGALGSLGVILQVSFKVAPLPPAPRTLRVSSSSASSLLALAAEVSAAGLATNGLVLSSGSDGWRLDLRFAGSEAAIDRSSRDLDALARRAGFGVEDTSAAQWDEATAACRPDGASSVVAKLSFPPKHLSVLVQSLSGARPQAIAAFPSVGVAWVRWPAPPLAAEIVGLRKASQSLGGALVIEAAPSKLKRAVGVWGEPRGDFPLMRRLKQEFDPKSTLNPGRYLGGL
jgi:glycolate oxidase FAD binding subunit